MFFKNDAAGSQMVIQQEMSSCEWFIVPANKKCREIGQLVTAPEPMVD